MVPGAAGVGGSLHSEGHQSTLMGEYMKAVIDDAIDDLDIPKLQALLKLMDPEQNIRRDPNFIAILRQTTAFQSDLGLIGTKRGATSRKTISRGGPQTVIRLRRYY